MDLWDLSDSMGSSLESRDSGTGLVLGWVRGLRLQDLTWCRGGSKALVGILGLALGPVRNLSSWISAWSLGLWVLTGS